MEEFDIGNVYIDTDDLDHTIFPKIEEFDSKEVREAFKFKYLRAKPCKLGFTPSNTSIAFKKFVNYTISRISDNS